jgi:ribosome recycling factor
MSPENVVSQVKAELTKATERFQEESKKLRTGRAHPSMVEQVVAEVYGAKMPLIQLATITTPEAQLIQISPFDPGNLQAIADAIRYDQSLGFNPTDDGRVIRIQIPPLTTERRQQIVKQLGEKKEECFVAMRQARHEALDALKKMKQDKTLSEDDQARYEKAVDEAMNKSKVDVETLAKNKEAEIMKV